MSLPFNIVSQFLEPVYVAPITLPEEYKSAIEKIQNLMESDIESGSEEELKLLELGKQIAIYERSLFHSDFYYQ